MANVGAPPKMNREQRRRFEKFLKSPEGQAKLAVVKAAEAKKKLDAARLAEAMGQRLTVTSPERVAQLESQR